MNADFAPFELAVKLKGKGFDYPCIGHYVNNQLYIAHYHNAFHSDNNESVDAPTISQVLKWLREEKKIHIATGYSNVSKWRYIIIHLGENFVKEANVWEKGFESYEQAALAGIEYVLNNLI